MQPFKYGFTGMGRKRFNSLSMETIKFTFEIVGGPNDGSTGHYEGKCESSNVVVAKVAEKEMNSYRCRVVTFDSEKMHATLMW